MRAVLLALFLVGCSGDSCPVNEIDPDTGELLPPPPDPRFCDLGLEPTASETVIAPSSSCASGACLRVPLEHELPACSIYPVATKGLCTGQCEADSDCDGLEGPCITGYACAIPAAVGAYCCLRLCVCRDFIEVPATGVSTPTPCDAANPANACCNLDGRADNATYPGCG